MKSGPSGVWTRSHPKALRVMSVRAPNSRRRRAAGGNARPAGGEATAVRHRLAFRRKHGIGYPRSPLLRPVMREGGFPHPMICVKALDFTQLDIGFFRTVRSFPATHQPAPGSPADRYARVPGACRWRGRRGLAVTSPCAGSQDLMRSASLPRTTASYQRHTTTALDPSGAAAIATRCPGTTRSLRGVGNWGAYRTEMTWS